MDYRRDEPVTTNWGSALQALRVVSVMLGIVLMAVGLTYAVRLFHTIHTVLQDPQSVETLLSKWSAAVGGSTLDVAIAGNSLHLAPTLAVFILGGGCFLLSWLSLGLVMAGARTLSWLLGDEEAVRRILLRAFGPARGGMPLTRVEPRGSGAGETAEQEAEAHRR